MSLTRIEGAGRRMGKVPRLGGPTGCGAGEAFGSGGFPGCGTGEASRSAGLPGTLNAGRTGGWDRVCPGIVIILVHGLGSLRYIR
jgi:hypothetical protein